MVLKDIKWYSCLIYTGGVVFMSLSFVLKERAFDKGASPLLLTVGVSIFMVPITFLIFPIQAIPGFGGLPVSYFPKIFKNGGLCTVGINNVTSMDCHNAWISLVIFCVFAFISGVAAVILTDKASAVVKTLSNGFTIPITSIGYSLYFIMGKYTEKFNIWDIIGTIIVIIGFIIYSYGRRINYKSNVGIQYTQIEVDNIIV